MAIMYGLKKWWSRYRSHIAISLFVYISFLISGFEYDLAKGASFAIYIYGFTQVFGLTISLSAIHFILQSRFGAKHNIFLLNLLAIIFGTFISFLLDYLVMAVLRIFYPQLAATQALDSIGEVSEMGLHFFLSYLEDLKFSVIFWPLYEIVYVYVDRITKVIYLEKAQKESFLNQLPFMNGVPVSERNGLLAIQAQQNYLRLIFPSKHYTVLFRLKDAISLIPEGVGVQIHRSYWVRMDAIDSFSGSNQIVLSNGQKLPVSRTYLREVKSQFENRTGVKNS